MPTYLMHGFRWPRPLIRIHIILQNLDDAAAEWLVAPGTTQSMLENFNELYPDSMKHLPRLRFIEQYDANDLSPTAASQPYAYVADIAEEVKLGANVDEVRGRGVGNEQWAAMMELRDKLAPEEKVGWYVVVCDDEERLAPETASQHGSSEVGEVGESSYQAPQNGRQDHDRTSSQESTPKGLKKLFGGGKFRRKSRTRAKSESQSLRPSSANPQKTVAAANSGQSQMPLSTP